MNSANIAHRLLSFLPSIYREDAFLGRYLAAFEEMLNGLEAQIGDIASLFDPKTAPEEFLPWLSSWVAFALRADLAPVQQREFLARIVSLYRLRGTKENLIELLSIFTTGQPTIEESGEEGPPHFFRVTLPLPPAPPDVQLRQSVIAHALIDLEKPAHTDYEVDLRFPTMQIGVTSHVGIDTLLGILPDAPPVVLSPPTTVKPPATPGKPSPDSPPIIVIS